MLYHHKNTSWIIVSKKTGKAVMETFSKSVADKINTEAYIVMPAHEWLASLSKS